MSQDHQEMITVLVDVIIEEEIIVDAITVVMIANLEKIRKKINLF
jgi:hypothetical protein